MEQMPNVNPNAIEASQGIVTKAAVTEIALLGLVFLKGAVTQPQKFTHPFRPNVEEAKPTWKRK